MRRQGPMRRRDLMPRPDPKPVRPRLRLPSLLVPSTVADEVDPPGAVRRRVVVVVLTLVIGAGLLSQTLSAEKGSGRFYGFALLAAATWVAGSLLSGPLHLGRRLGLAGEPREIVGPILLGVAAFAVFAGAAVVAHHVSVLDRALRSVLAKADAGPAPVVVAVAVVNGIGEEVFFRGALHTMFGRRSPALLATVLYAVVTVATGNVALVVAAVVMGSLFAVERLATRGILAPILTHVTWSILMVLALPR